jgi:hypothetical protein
VSRLGLDGFDGAEPDFAVGSVKGARYWNLDIGALDLTGMHGGWHRGENTAACIRGHAAPDLDCSCGFWAYWASPNPHGFAIPVLGVIEGYGRTLIGELGFRCSRARILALHLPGAVTVQTRAEDEARRMTAVTLLGQVRFHSDAAMETWRTLTGREYCRPPRPDPDEALARKAEAELALGDRYGVPVYASLALMLSEHPPTADYLPPENRPVVLPGPRLTGAEALAQIRAMADPPE